MSKLLSDLRGKVMTPESEPRTRRRRSSGRTLFGGV